MKFKELANMSAEEQEMKLRELELELIKLNSQVATGTPPKNSGLLKKTKKDIARLMLLGGMRAKKAEIQRSIKAPSKQDSRSTKSIKSDKSTPKKDKKPRTDLPNE
ncbi:MAG: 50S ribosomal protein L29 [archaeon]